MSIILKSGSSGNLAGVDSNSNLLVNLPTTATQAGFSQLSYTRDSTTSRPARVSLIGDLATSVGRTMFSCSFNGAAAGALGNNQWNQQATTLATATQAGFLRFNSGVVTTTTTGVSINTWATFTLERNNYLSLKSIIRHTNGSQLNKVFEFGFGYYDVAANQQAAPNEFIGFRWTASGGLLGVLEYSTGASPTSVTVNINGAIPYSDAISKEYEVVVSQTEVEFWIDNVYQAKIAHQVDAAGIMKSSGLPILVRQYHPGTPSIAPVFELGHTSITKYGTEADVPISYRQAIMGRGCYNNQAGILATNGSPVTVPASGTTPTGTTGSNTATTLTGLGGYYNLNGAAVTGTNHSQIILTSYQNPTVPETSGAANDGRVLVITDIMISPMVVSVILAGGGAAWTYFIAVGSTALSLATADAIGGAAIGTKSPRYLILPILDSVAATAAAGTVVTRAGSSNFSLNTPLVVNPGEFIHSGIRTCYVNAAITSGNFLGGISFSGFWL